MPGGNPDVVPYKSIRGDSPSWFDDVDDYKGYVRTANSADISGYTLTVNVYYVKKNNDEYSCKLPDLVEANRCDRYSSYLFDKCAYI